MRLFLLLLIISNIWQLSVAFEVRPYVQIDYLYYHRLAQCEAKCTEKYGTLMRKRLLDGSTRQYFNTSNDSYQMCAAGCRHTRIIPAKNARSLADAFKDGQELWKASGKDLGSVGSSPIESVRVLCMTMMESPTTGYLDSFEALMAVGTKTEFASPIRYLIQWKQRAAGQKHIEETGWITASIESSSSFKAEGLQPGMEYRFLVTAISPSGRIGKAVHSDWTETPLLGSQMALPGGPLVFRSHYNSDDNVSATVHWFSTTMAEPTSLTPAMNSPNVVHRAPHRVMGCQLQLTYANDTYKGKEEFEMDESQGFLLNNLEFNSVYNVTLTSRNSNAKVEGKLRSISCVQVFGQGSLECDPEPVQSVNIDVNAENASAIVSWQPSMEAKHVLVYQIIYEPLSTSEPCAIEAMSLYLTAETTSTTIELPTSATCEYELRLINYDLVGREATYRKRFLFSAPPVMTSASFEFSENLWLFLAPTSILIALCAILRFAACWQTKFKKVAEIGAKRPIPEAV